MNIIDSKNYPRSARMGIPRDVVVISGLPDRTSMRIEDFGYEDVASREVEWHGGDEGGEEGEDGGGERKRLVAEFGLKQDAPKNASSRDRIH